MPSDIHQALKPEPNEHLHALHMAVITESILSSIKGDTQYIVWSTRSSDEQRLCLMKKTNWWLLSLLFFFFARRQPVTKFFSLQRRGKCPCWDSSTKLCTECRLTNTSDGACAWWICVFRNLRGPLGFNIISYYARMSVIQDLFIGQDQLT